MKPLPPELWGIIVDHLPREDQKTCLCLSKLHRHFALSALFSHIHVYFGLWTLDNLDEDQSDEKLAELELKNNITWDILRHITLCPDFATIVQRLTILAYVGGRDGIFHNRALIEAIEAMPNLRAFHWHGDSPPLTHRVLTALVQSSGRSLEEVHVRIALDTAALRCLSAFTNVRRLRLIDDYTNTDFELEDGPVRALLDAVDAMSSTLTRIAIQGDVFWQCSVRSLLGLQELELIQTEGANGLALVFRHCSSLRSLTLFPLALDELFAGLKSDPTALPELRALKFIYSEQEEVFHRRHAETFAVFVKNKKKLTSLDVEVRPMDRIDGEPILDAIRELPCVEVLGFSFMRSEWTPLDFVYFRDLIPHRVTALRLSASVDGPEIDDDVLLQYWFDIVKSRSSLRYLHIFNIQRNLDLTQRIHEDPPASLELFGYGPFIRRLVRDHDGRSMYSPCWSASKLKFRSAEDFGCAEWEWLLRWHDHFDTDDLAPGGYDGMGRALLE